MRVNLVFGRSGTGKSEYLYKDITSKMCDKKIFLIVPEQCNLSAEKKLFDISGKTSLIDVEILTLSRMAYRVENEVGFKNMERLSKVGKEMIIFDLLTKEKSNLNFLGRSDKNVEVVSRLFTELKKHSITCDTLNNTEIEDTYTSLKLNDVKILFNKYEEKIRDNFLDENDSLTILAENLDKTDLLDGSLVYIDEFLGFTPQEYKVFEKILSKAEEVTVAIPLDEEQEKTIEKEKNIFYFNEIFAKKIEEISSGAGCEVNKTYLKETYRFKNKELKFLEENLYLSNKKYQDEPEHIKLFMANNPYSEIEYVASTIHNLTKNCGIRYRDIGIITENVDTYAEDAKAIMRKFDIPIFIDEKKALNQNILIKFIICLLDIYAQNFSYDAFFNYIKTGLLGMDNETLYELENYARKWGIKGNKWSKEFKYEEVNDKQEKLEEARKKIVEPLIKFKDDVSNNRTVTEITKQIYQFIIDNGIKDELVKKIENYGKDDVSNEYSTSYKLLIGILDEMCLIFKDEKVTFEKYRDLLETGLNAEELGKIPATQDEVVLGDTERTRSNKIKVLFVIGINDGFFPKASRDEGFLNDSDRKILLENGIELAKDSIDALYEEEFNIYRTLSTPEEDLYLSYASQDKETKTIRPSILIKKIRRLFPKLKEESDVVERKHFITTYDATFEEALVVYKEYLDGKEIPEEWKDLIRYFYNKNKKEFKRAVSGIYYSNLSEDISEENIKKLYGNTMRTSISRLESYKTCPFSFHLKYGLKLKEKDEMKIGSIDTGTFQHEVIDSFFKEIDEQGINLKDLTEEEIKKIVNKIVSTLLETSKYYVFNYSAKFRLLTRRLKKVVYQSILYIVYSLNNSNFEVLGHEIEFSDYSEYKPITIEVDSGRKVEITGKIDRVDKAMLGEDQYIRIIDYKSSTRDIDLNKVVNGLQIQLVTYMDAMCEKSNFEPSAMLYMGLVDETVKNAKNLSDEELEKKIRSNFRMKGLVLADVDIIRMMDKSLGPGVTSDIIPVAMKQNGELASSSKVIKKEDFENLRKEVREVIKEISEEILKGKVSIYPYNYKKKTGCDYCSYKSICMFNPSIKGNTYNYIRERQGD